MANIITGFLNRLLNPHHTDQDRYYNAAADQLLGISHTTGMSQYDTSLQTNIQEAEKNRLFQQQMVNEERAYNTPAAQMERARAAGLNPSLLYGQPISEAGSAPAGSEASVGMGSGGDLSRLVTGVPSMVADIRLKNAQALETESRIPVNQKRADNLESLTVLNTKNLEVADAEIAYKSILGEKLGMDTYETFVRVNQSIASFDKKMQLLDAEIREKTASANKDDAQAGLLLEQAKYYYQDLLKQWQLINSQIGLNNAQRLDAYAGAVYKASEAKVNAAEAEYKRLVNDATTPALLRAQMIVGMGSDILSSIGGFINVGSKVVNRRYDRTHKHVTRTKSYDSKGNLTGASQSLNWSE